MSLKVSICTALLSFLLPTTLAATSGDFNILSFNVAGLPEILQNNEVPGDKATNAGTIGSKFAQYGYDVIHAQEDFNYHAYIYATDNHPYRTATSGGVPFGSGLNTLSNYNWTSFDRIKWNQCDNNEADCLTPKGFTAMRLQLDDGVYIDFYNLHADAGSNSGDFAARTSNFQQVADYINANSVGNAVVLYGDTNSRYTNAQDNIRLFGTQNNLTDTWVELIKGGVTPASGSPALVCENPSTTNECEVVDKVLYRGSRVIDLQATYWNYESTKFLQTNGSVLSDHNPITVNFTWSLSATLQQSSTWGGPYGTWFSDLPSIPAASTGPNKPSTLTLHGNARLDSVSLALASGTAYTHGGAGGNPASLTLDADEYWTQARLCRGTHNGQLRNFYLLATTSKGRTVSAGTSTGDCKVFEAPAGWQVVGFFGRGGDEVDELGFVYGLV